MIRIEIFKNKTDSILFHVNKVEFIFKVDRIYITFEDALGQQHISKCEPTDKIIVRTVK